MGVARPFHGLFGLRQDAAGGPLLFGFPGCGRHARSPNSGLMLRMAVMICPKSAPLTATFGQLEGDFAGVAHHSCTDFDQAALDACE